MTVMEKIKEQDIYMVCIRRGANLKNPILTR